MGFFMPGTFDREKVSKFFMITCLPLVGLALVYGGYLQSAYGYCPRALCDK